MYNVYKDGCIVSRHCTRTEAVKNAEKLGWKKDIPAKLQNIYIVKDKELRSTGKMRVKNSRNTYNKMEFAGSGYGKEIVCIKGTNRINNL